MVTVMTVEPGFGGQKLMPGPLEKVKKLKEQSPGLLVEVDGGVNRETLAPVSYTHLTHSSRVCR